MRLAALGCRSGTARGIDLRAHRAAGAPDHFGDGSDTTVTPPSGLTLVRREDRTTTLSQAIYVRGADVVQASPAATGNKVATAGSAAVDIGQLVALQPDVTAPTAQSITTLDRDLDGKVDAPRSSLANSSSTAPSPLARGPSLARRQYPLTCWPPPTTPRSRSASISRPALCANLSTLISVTSVSVTALVITSPRRSQIASACCVVLVSSPIGSMTTDTSQAIISLIRVDYRDERFRREYNVKTAGRWLPMERDGTHRMRVASQRHCDHRLAAAESSAVLAA